MLALYCVCCVDETANLLGVPEELSKTLPIVTPGLDNDGIQFAPLDFKVIQFHFCSLLADGAIDEFQIPQELLLMLAANVLDGVAYLMYDAELHSRMGENAQNSVREAFQTIYATYMISSAPRFCRSVRTYNQT